MLSQVYPPDPASVGQHMADAAAEMARRGWRVIVLTSNRGYNDPSIKYKPREVMDGVEVRRLPLSSFGKKHFALRILAAVLFMCQCILVGGFTRGLTSLLVSTSPPMCIVAALAISFFRRCNVKFWVMDLNPDQLIALGKIKRRSLPARLMDWFNRMILRRSSDVVVLDRFMAQRVLAKLDVSRKLTILPPWPHIDAEQPVAHAENHYRDRHNLQGKVVFMYSGNHGIALPLDTILSAAVKFKNDPRAVFMFIGDGVRKKEVEQTIRDHDLKNMFSQPYEPLSVVRYSLSAADVHLVSMDDGMVGIIHPCKIYGAMAVGRPVLLVGPAPSHASELIEKHRIGWHIAHGDLAAAETAMRAVLNANPDELAAMGARASAVMRQELSKATLCGGFCDVLERDRSSLPRAHPSARASSPGIEAGHVQGVNARSIP